MPATYEPIATTTLSTSAVSFTLSSIPSTYTDLRLVVVPVLKDNSFGDQNVGVQFNSDTGSNYSRTFIRGDGSAANSFRTSNTTSFLVASTSITLTTTPILIDLNVFSYAGSTFKTALCQTSADRNGAGAVGSFVGLWRSTSAITAITVFTDYEFGTGTTATLYGIKNA